jgi:two-component system OmpR family sensor kinase
MSLRARLMAGMAVVAFVLVFAAVVITRTTQAYLVDRLDAQLTDAVIPARALDSARRFPVPTPSNGSSLQSLNALYVARVAGDKVTVLSVPRTVSGKLPLPRLSAARAVDAARAEPPEPFTVDAKSGSAGYRALALPSPIGTTLVLALSLRDVDASVHRLVLVEIIATASVIAILGLVTFWALRLGVRPIKQMTATATAIAAGDLSQRVTKSRHGTEAGELGDALNTMMARIEHAFELRAASEARLRQFVADASHELRTPVTTIRGYAELYRHGGLDQADELAQAMRRTEQESVRMGALVDDLLLLAHLDEGRPLDRDPVDLGVLAVDAAADARAVAPDRVIEAHLTEGVTVDGDEDRLRQVLGNLVGNALVHSPADAAITVRVGAIGSRAIVEVHDGGPGMEPALAARAFERFSRADASRSRAAGGTGLGLAIVKAIAQAHGGWVSLSSAPGEGTTVRVELPATGPSAPFSASS